MGNFVCLDNSEQKPQVSVLIVGKSGVGKTKIINTLRKINEDIYSTLKIERHLIMTKKAELLLIDTPGDDDHFAECISKFTIQHIQAIVYVGGDIDLEKQHIIQQLALSENLKIFHYNSSVKDTYKFFSKLIDQVL